MSDIEPQSQTVEDIDNNIVKIIDNEGNFKGTGFFIKINKQNYCITCHHCIYELDNIFIQRHNIKSTAEWLEQYSNPIMDIAVLKAENLPFKSLLYAKEAMANFQVSVRGFSGEKLKTLPEGTSGRPTTLSDSAKPFEVNSEEFISKNKWNTKPKVYVNVYECEGKFEFGFSGSPVCFKGPNKVVGMFTAKDDYYGYVIPIQTILNNFDNSKIIAQPQSNKNIKDYLEKGNTCYYDRQYRDAIKYYDEIIKDFNYLSALSNKGRSLTQLGDNVKALDLFKEVLEIDPNFVFALNGMGLVESNLGDYEKATEWYDKVLKIDPNDKAALNNKGVAFSKLGDYEKATEWYDKVLKIDPNDKDALKNKGIAFSKLGDYEKATEWYDKVLKIDPNDKAALKNKGIAFSKLGDYEKATEWYDKVLKINPNDKDALNNKGIAFSNLGDYEKAIDWYDKVLKIDPNYLLALNNKGVAFSNLGDYEKAIDWYDKVLKIDPNYLLALKNKGVAFSNLGDYEKAIEWYDKAIKIDPNDKNIMDKRKIAEEKLNKL